MLPVLMNRTDNILGQRGEQTQVTTLLAQHIISCAGTGTEIEDQDLTEISALRLLTSLTIKEAK